VSERHDTEHEPQLEEAREIAPDNADDGGEDIIFTVRTAEPLLPGIDTATVQCIRVEGPEEFNCWGSPRKRLIFILKVIEPNAYAGTKLKMFVEFNPAWPYIPRSAKLYKLVQLVGNKMVVGSELRFNQMFRNKIFKCRLKQVGGRTVVENLTSKVVG
jgi:hypothetical protein